MFKGGCIVLEHSYPHQGGYLFTSVCLFACPRDYIKTTEQGPYSQKTFILNLGVLYVKFLCRSRFLKVIHKAAET